MIESSCNNTVHRSAQQDTSLVKQTTKQGTRDFESLFTSLGESEDDSENYEEKASDLEQPIDSATKYQAQTTTIKESKSRNGSSDEQSNENLSEVNIGGTYTSANLTSNIANTPVTTAEKPVLDTQKLIDQLCAQAKTLINKAEVCVDKENKTFSIAILDSFLKDTEILVSNKDHTNIITIKPSNADQYQFLQKEKETLRKKIKENDSDANIDILIEEP